MEKTTELESVLKQVAKLLADNTNYTSLISKPRYQHKKVKFTQINQVSENQLLIIIVIEGNVVKNKFIDISEPIDPETLPQINFLINAALDGMVSQPYGQ